MNYYVDVIKNGALMGRGEEGSYDISGDLYDVNVIGAGMFVYGNVKNCTFPIAEFYSNIVENSTFGGGFVSANTIFINNTITGRLYLSPDIRSTFINNKIDEIGIAGEPTEEVLQSNF